MRLFGIEHTTDACESCLELLGSNKDLIRIETVLPVPAGARASMSYRKVNGKHPKLCLDCAAAETLIKIMRHGKDKGMSFLMARIATGNDRQEMLRLPGSVIGLAVNGIMRSSSEGDLDTLRAWQRFTVGTEDDRDAVRADMKLMSEKP